VEVRYPLGMANGKENGVIITVNELSINNILTSLKDRRMTDSSAWSF